MIAGLIFLGYPCLPRRYNSSLRSAVRRLVQVRIKTSAVRMDTASHNFSRYVTIHPLGHAP
jgi:hypothetical protein